MPSALSNYKLEQKKGVQLLMFISPNKRETDIFSPDDSSQQSTVADSSIYLHTYQNNKYSKRLELLVACSF